jgi:arsenate reductase
MTQQSCPNILFVCTGNCARSIMAEALLTSLSNGGFKGHSAGTRPGGLLNPFALERIRKLGYPVESLRNKSWNEFSGPHAPRMQAVITVCSFAAAEAAPTWPGAPLRAQWPFEPPMSAGGSAAAKRAVFHRLYKHIELRIREFLDLQHGKMTAAELQKKLDEIGLLEA